MEKVTEPKNYKKRAGILLGAAFTLFCIGNLNSQDTYWLTASIGNAVAAVAISAIVGGIAYLFKKDKVVFYKYSYHALWCLVVIYFFYLSSNQ